MFGKYQNDRSYYINNEDGKPMTFAAFAIYLGGDVEVINDEGRSLVIVFNPEADLTATYKESIRESAIAHLEEEKQ